MHHTRARLVAIFALLALLGLLAGACGDPERPTLQQSQSSTTVPIDSGGAKPQGSVPGGTDSEVVETNSEVAKVALSTAAGEHEVFDAPDGTVIERLPNPWVGESPLVFLLTAEGQSTPGWYEVYLPVRPNGSIGYIRRGDAEITTHSFRIEVRLADFKIILFENGEPLIEAPIAVAADNTPTPGGLYYTTELIRPPDPNGTYGSFAYGLSGYSEVLTTFGSGPGQLGIHGTNQPELMGQKVSHGCIRMTNEDIERFVPLLPLGVPVEIIE